MSRQWTSPSNARSYVIVDRTRCARRANSWPVKVSLTASNACLSVAVYRALSTVDCLLSALSQVHSLLINATSPKTGATFFRDGCFSTVNALFLGPGKQSLGTGSRGEERRGRTSSPNPKWESSYLSYDIRAPPRDPVLRDRLRPIKSRVSQF